MLRKVILGSLFCFAGQAFSSDVRTTSVGSPAGIDDEVMMFTYPSLVSRYSLALAELGTPGTGSTEAYIAASTTLGFGSVGFAISRDESLMGSAKSNDVDFLKRGISGYSLNSKLLNGTQVGTGPQRPVDVFFGKASGDKGWGVRATFAGDLSETNNDDGKTTNTAEQLDVHGGYHMPVSTGRLDIGVKVGGMGSVKLENEAAKSGVEYIRGISFGASVRFVEVLNTLTRPYYKASFDWSTPEFKETVADDTEGKKGSEIWFDTQAGIIHSPTMSTNLNVGVGAFYMASEGNFTLDAATTAAQIRAGSESYTATPRIKDKTKRTGYGLVANAGVEALITERAGFLAGVQYPLWGRLVTKDQVSAKKPTYTSNLPDLADSKLISGGFFYKLDAFRFDASLNWKDFMHAGPNFITGGVTANLVGKAAASYRF